MRRCHTDKGVYIPGCMGGAARGRDYCTCTRKSELESMDADLTRYGKQIAALKKRVDALEKTAPSAPAAGGA